ncbi:DUF4870 domain-containing protein [Oleiagrimonas sp. C23AA]|uniref:DUF4870 domain-containing protein n=1 Tax=Oleiagrimonas sp. C23AA TaxID=2719047 RepID=UPI00141F39C3|nr:DUF4870 domain-containing protein [Oleiagrimonas sp. C23AA]NII10101.1 DUF4870 domain-containing protein [Oleiagrimonas sp. C23AA]
MKDVSASQAPTALGADNAEQRKWAMLVHISALVTALLTGRFFGVGCFLGPLLLWAMKKETMPYVHEQGRQAINFNLTVMLALIVIILLGLGVSMHMGRPLGLAVILLLGALLLAFWAISVIVAVVKTSNGEAFRYRLAIRFIRPARA